MSFPLVDIDELDRRLKALETSRWSGPPLKQGFPRVPQLDALPTPSEDFEGRLIYIPYASGTAGKVYICRLAADGATWEWSELDNVAAVDLSAIPFMVGAASGLLSAEYVSGSTPALGYPGIILRGSNVTEQTTVSTSAVDLVTITGLSIPITSGLRISLVWRKSAGAAAVLGLGLKINSTIVVEAGTGATYWAQSSGDNQAESGFALIEIGPRSANYLTSAIGMHSYNTNAIPALSPSVTPTNPFPNAPITSIAIRAISGSGSVTAAVKEVAVNEVLYS